MDAGDLKRRDFFKLGAAGAAGLAVGAAAPLRAHGPAAPLGPMPSRPLGSTGHQVRLFSLGGQATLEQPGREGQAVEIIHRALDLGVNYIDTAAAYGRGISQRYIGKVMKTRRDEVFLATKTHLRSRDESMGLLEDSLRSLQTDHLDLWQIHNITRQDEVDRIFAPGGAMDALVEAKEQGIVKNLGITGHYDPAPLMNALERFDFDTILLALNPTDPHLTPFATELLPLANRKGMGVIAMKLACRGRIFRDTGLRTMSDSMGWVLSHPVSTVIIGVDTVTQLEENVRIATAFEPMGPAELTRVAALTEEYVEEAAFFKLGGVGWS